MASLTMRWCDDFEEMDFSVIPHDLYNPDLTRDPDSVRAWTSQDPQYFNRNLSKLVDKYVVEMSKFPMEFIPESHCKRLNIFVKISRVD